MQHSHLCAALPEGPRVSSTNTSQAPSTNPLPGARCMETCFCRGKGTLTGKTAAPALLQKNSNHFFLFFFFLNYFAHGYTAADWSIYCTKNIFLTFIFYFFFTWLPPMPWQLKMPTFSFSLRPMLSKHWLVSTFLIWRKKEKKRSVKKYVSKCRICREKIT